jgi:hypothetical protein
MRPPLQTLFGIELSTGGKVAVASFVILVLLVLLGLFVRQIQGGRLRMKGQGGGRARQPRLGVVDTHDLDRQRQLVLIRRDNVEHLVMIGGASDVVVETNILRSGGRAAPPPPDSGMTERPAVLEALPPAETARHEPSRADMQGASVALVQPAPDMLPPLPTRQTSAPAAVPTPPARHPSPVDMAAMAGAIAVPAGMAAAASSSPQPAPSTPAPSLAAQPPSFARDHAPSPAASAIELDDMARQLEEALKRPFSAVRPANSPGEPPRGFVPPPEPGPARSAPVEPPKPGPAAITAEPEPEPETAAHPAEEPSALPMPTPPAPPVTTGRPVTLPADVEAELELALGLKPGRVKSMNLDMPAPPPVFAPAKPELVVTYEPSPPVAQEQPADVEPDPPAEPEPVVEPEAEQEGVAEAKESPPEPDAGPKPQSRPEPEPKSEPKPAAIDPFSVDAIEAEFARLLGRDPKSKS